MNKKWMLTKIRQHAYMCRYVDDAANDDSEDGHARYLQHCEWLRLIEDEIKQELDRLYDKET